MLLPLQKVKDKKLKGSIKRSEREITAAAEAAARAELLLPEDAGYGRARAVASCVS